MNNGKRTVCNTACLCPWRDREQFDPTGNKQLTKKQTNIYNNLFDILLLTQMLIEDLDDRSGGILVVISIDSSRDTTKSLIAMQWNWMKRERSTNDASQSVLLWQFDCTAITRFQLVSVIYLHYLQEIVSNKERMSQIMIYLFFEVTPP